jgi:hypothetical protein
LKQNVSEYDIDSKSNKSQQKNERNTLDLINSGLKTNPNDILSIQLTKYLHENMKEISNIKMENGRLLEKYKNEQKTVAKLKEEIKRK